MIFTNQLGRLDGLSDKDAVKAIANHLRTMQEELEWRLTNLDSSNINEIEMESTTITAGGKDINNILSDASGGVSAIQQTVEGLSTTVMDQGESISNLQQTAQGLTTTVATQGQSITTLQQKDNTISAAVTNLQNGQKAMLKMDSSGVYITNASGQTVSIDGAQIKAGTIRVGSLYGEEIYLQVVDFWGNTLPVAKFALSESSSSSLGKLAITANACSINAQAGNVYLQGTVPSLEIGLLGGSFYGAQVGNGHLVPYSGNSQYSLGQSGYLWNQVWAQNGTIQTSDRNEKDDISYDLGAYDAFFDKLQPVTFKMKNGTSDRHHVGLIAQDVEQALEESGIDSKDFAGFVSFDKEDGEKGYALRYGEFIGLCIRKIQQLEARVKELESKEGE